MNDTLKLAAAGVALAIIAIGVVFFISVTDKARGHVTGLYQRLEQTDGPDGHSYVIAKSANGLALAHAGGCWCRKEKP